MSDAGSSSANPQLEYLQEFHRRFSLWGISPPRFSEEERTLLDRSKVASHLAVSVPISSPPPPPPHAPQLLATSAVNSALTKCLEVVSDFLRITNFSSATKQLKGEIGYA